MMARMRLEPDVAPDACFLRSANAPWPRGGLQGGLKSRIGRCNRTRFLQVMDSGAAKKGSDPNRSRSRWGLPRIGASPKGVAIRGWWSFAMRVGRHWRHGRTLRSRPTFLPRSDLIALTSRTTFLEHCVSPLLDSSVPTFAIPSIFNKPEKKQYES